MNSLQFYLSMYVLVPNPPEVKILKTILGNIPPPLLLLMSRRAGERCEERASEGFH